MPSRACKSPVKAGEVCLPSLGWPIEGWPDWVSLLAPGPNGSTLSLPPLQMCTMVSLRCHPGRCHWGSLFYNDSYKTLTTTINAFSQSHLEQIMPIDAVKHLYKIY